MCNTLHILTTLCLQEKYACRTIILLLCKWCFRLEIVQTITHTFSLFQGLRRILIMTQLLDHQSTKPQIHGEFGHRHPENHLERQHQTLCAQYPYQHQINAILMVYFSLLPNFWVDCQNVSQNKKRIVVKQWQYFCKDEVQGIHVQFCITKISNQSFLVLRSLYHSGCFEERRDRSRIQQSRCR